MSEEEPVHFLNLEYFFRLLYEALFAGGKIGDFSSLAILASKIWFAVGVLSYLISFGALAVIIYTSLRIKQIRAAEAHLYHTEHPAHAETKRDHSRWAHVQELMLGTQESDWRQAIIEADIMLDDLLNQLGYHGATMADKFRQVDRSRFQTLDMAMEAHGVRNRIAHEGSSYPISETLAHRTIQQYEAVMREHGEIT
jgi:hypothetical protein